MHANPICVRIVDGDGEEHTANFPRGIEDMPCVVCRELHPGMNLLAMSGTFFCDSCWYKMGMRSVGGGVYAHIEPDALFVGCRSNIPACPTYDADFGASTPYEIIQRVKGRPALRRAIDECLGEHGCAVTREDLQEEATTLLGALCVEQFDCLVEQGML